MERRLVTREEMLWELQRQDTLPQQPVQAEAVLTFTPPRRRPGLLQRANTGAAPLSALPLDERRTTQVCRCHIVSLK